MRLTLIEHAGQPVDPPRSVLFSSPGGTVGRGADNHLVLPDDSRQISRLQASVRISGAGAWLKNLSSVCVMTLNGQVLDASQEYALAVGDALAVGLYQLRVDPVEAPAAVAVPVAEIAEAPVAEAAPVPAPAVAATEAAPTAPTGALPPASFWDNLVQEFTTPNAPAAHFKPAAPELPPLAAAPAPAAQFHAGASDDALASIRTQAVDPLALFGSADLDAPSALFSDSPGLLAPAASTDPLGLGLPDTTGPASASNRTSELAGHFQAPKIVAPTAAYALSGGDIAITLNAPLPGSSTMAEPPQPAHPVSVIQAATRPVPNSNSPAELLTAFIEGAGFTNDINALSATQFRQAGTLLTGFISGTMGLLSSRTIIKREVKADLTLILDRENNPLKLLPEAQTVLKQMFGLPFPGFMAPEQAMDDAFHDLHAHQIGMLAGMRAALNQLLRDFAPERIADKMPNGPWYENVLPGNKSGRAWDEYRALHQSMVTAVEEDFHTVFGAAFLAAYDAEIEVYHQQRKGHA